MTWAFIHFSCLIMFNAKEHIEYFCIVVSATSVEHKFQSHIYLLLPLL